jgi:6-phosphogluconolactonase
VAHPGEVNRLPEEGPPNFEVRVLPDADEAARAAALEIFHAAGDAISNRGVFRIALSGGTTPVRLFRMLAEPPYRDRPDWARTQFFFVDERCVPSDDARSNYRLAKEHLLDPLQVPAENVFRMRGEDDPRHAAAEYESVLEREFGGRDSVPRFDFVLLGLGTDGHTASLFPGTRAIEERERTVVANWVPQQNEWRLTLTLPVLNASRWDVFLVTGAEKSAVVASAVERKKGSHELPASLVRPEKGSLIWIVDEAAAAEL